MGKALWILLGSILLALIFGLSITVLVVFCLDEYGIHSRWGMIFAVVCGWGAWLICRKRVLSLFGLDTMPNKTDK